MRCIKVIRVITRAKVDIVSSIFGVLAKGKGVRAIYAATYTAIVSTHIQICSIRQQWAVKPHSESRVHTVDDLRCNALHRPCTRIRGHAVHLVQ